MPHPNQSTAMCSTYIVPIERARVLSALGIKLIAPARTCQYPKWGDEPSTHEYCGKPTVDGTSYCKKHRSACYVPRDPKKRGKSIAWFGKDGKKDKK